MSREPDRKARRRELRRQAVRHLVMSYREVEAAVGVACGLVAIGALLDWRWALLALGALLVADSGVVRR